MLCIGCPDSIPARYRQPNLPPSEAISQTPHISSESFIVHRTDRHVSLVKAPPHFVKIAAACLGVASNDNNGTRTARSGAQINNYYDIYRRDEQRGDRLPGWQGKSMVSDQEQQDDANNSPTTNDYRVQLVLRL